ncbi:hypothetical protein D3C72_2186030 [compost metagenome]
MLSEITVGRKNSRSGRFCRTCCTSEVASASGGVKTCSSTTSSPTSASSPAFIRSTEDKEAAVLSVMMATVFGRLPDCCSARSRMIGSASCAWTPAVADVWKMFLNPRPVIWSE